jgi:hypothetical protein
MKLQTEELALYLQCIAEVLYGFRVPEFEQSLGISEGKLADEYTRLRAFQNSAHLDANLPDVQLRSAVIKTVMEELGSEFQTRTGYHLPEAAQLFDKSKTG